MDFLAYILDQFKQLEDLHELSHRAMFGGYGLYLEGCFFGIVHRESLYFKTHPHTVNQYLALGSSVFSPSAKQSLKHYYLVPGEVLDDRETLCQWAIRAANLLDDEQ